MIYLVAGKARSGKDYLAQMMQEQLDNCVIISITKPLKDYAHIITNWDYNEDTKPREFLQNIGSNIKKHLLINRLMEDIDVISKYKDNIIVTGIRLKEEIEILKSNYNVKTIKVIRPNFDNNLTVSEKNHITETDLDNFKLDYDIINDSNFKKNIINLINEVK